MVDPLFCYQDGSVKAYAHLIYYSGILAGLLLAGEIVVKRPFPNYLGKPFDVQDPQWDEFKEEISSDDKML
jgi:hypothetical protein